MKADTVGTSTDPAEEFTGLGKFVRAYSTANGVGFENPQGVPPKRVWDQAARSYSWTMPPRMSRRVIARPSECSRVTRKLPSLTM